MRRPPPRARTGATRRSARPPGRRPGGRARARRSSSGAAATAWDRRRRSRTRTAMLWAVIGLLYDVHGNLPALEAVLDDARGLGVGRWIVGGDMVLFGAWP